ARCGTPIKIDVDPADDRREHLKAEMADVRLGKSNSLYVIGWRITDDDLIGIERLMNLASLTLDSRHITDKTIGRIKSLYLLEDLDLTSCSASPAGVLQIERLPRLNTLSLHG